MICRSLAQSPSRLSLLCSLASPLLSFQFFRISCQLFRFGFLNLALTRGLTGLGLLVGRLRRENGLLYRIGFDGFLLNACLQLFLNCQGTSGLHNAGLLNCFGRLLIGLRNHGNLLGHLSSLLTCHSMPRFLLFEFWMKKGLMIYSLVLGRQGLEFWCRLFDGLI